MPCLAAVFLALALLATPLAGRAQQTAKKVKIGYLGTASPSPSATSPLGAFRLALQQLGYVEGQSMAIEAKFAEGRLERLPELAAELVRLAPDVVFAPPTPAAIAVRRATTTIPIVFVTAEDPVAAGLAASLARPGGNATGLSYLGAELNPKRVELLREVIPHATRFAVLGNPHHPLFSPMLANTDAAGRELGLQIQVAESSTPSELEPAFQGLVARGVEGLVVLPDFMLFLERRRVAQLAGQHRLPAIFELREFTESGGLMSYGAYFPELFRRAASYVDRILKGAKPADLPIEQPTKFELVINLKTAKALGLTIPPSVLARADEVIE